MSILNFDNTITLEFLNYRLIYNKRFFGDNFFCFRVKYDKNQICLLHFPAWLVSSQPTSCFDHELTFSVANAGQPTSFSIEALYTSIGETPFKNFPLSVVKLWSLVVIWTTASRPPFLLLLKRDKRRKSLKRSWHSLEGRLQSRSK